MSTESKELAAKANGFQEQDASDNVDSAFI